MTHALIIKYTSRAVKGENMNCPYKKTIETRQKNSSVTDQQPWLLYQTEGNLCYASEQKETLSCLILVVRSQMTLNINAYQQSLLSSSETYCNVMANIFTIGMRAVPKPSFSWLVKINRLPLRHGVFPAVINKGIFLFFFQSTVCFHFVLTYVYQGVFCARLF